jgi:DNA-binding GntR family transcriptional regulator
MAEDNLAKALGSVAQPIRRTLTEDVADKIRDAIIRGRFEPGQRLSEPVLAKVFNISRGPVREALATLQGEGLLTIERHRGTRVTRLSLIDIDEIYSLRDAIESLATELAVSNASDEDFGAMEAVIAGLAEATESGDVRRVVELDVAFHDLVYRASGHARLYRSWSSLRPQIITFLLSRSVNTRDYLPSVLPEHRELLKKLRSRDATAAVTQIKEHIRSSYERLRQRWTPDTPDVNDAM